MAEQWNKAVNAVAKKFPDNNLIPVSYSLANSSLVAVSPGATLDLNGCQTSVADLTVSGNLQPGGGALSVGGNLVLDGTANIAFGIGTTNDVITVSGDLILDGTLNLSDTGGFAPGNYTIVTYAGNLTDNGLSIGSTPAPGIVYQLDTSNPGQVELTVSTPYQIWQSLHFGIDAGDTLIAGPQADPDFDGIANLLEYFTGTVPTDPSKFPNISTGGFASSSLLASYPRALNRPDVTGFLEWGTDLQTWYESGESNGSLIVDISETTVSAAGADPEIIEATFQTSPSPKPPILFFRLRIESE